MQERFASGGGGVGGGPSPQGPPSTVPIDGGPAGANIPRPGPPPQAELPQSLRDNLTPAQLELLQQAMMEQRGMFDHGPPPGESTTRLIAPPCSSHLHDVSSTDAL
eukprot:3135703-Rhodomonas_salina.1